MARLDKTTKSCNVTEEKNHLNFISKKDVMEKPRINIFGKPFNLK